VAAASLLLLLPHFHVPLSEADEGILATGAERILRGQIPYRDFFSELGPASFYLQAAIFKLGSIHVTALRLTAWLLGGTLAGLIYLLARKVLRRVTALLAAAILPLICYPSAYRVSHHWWANLFLLLTVLTLATESQAGDGRDSRRGGRLVLAGVLAGMTLLAMQSKGFWTIAAGAVFLCLAPGLDTANWRGANLKTGFRQAAWFMIGAFAAVGSVAAYFASQGALRAWIDDNLVFLFTNYRAYLDVPQASAVLTLLHMGGLALAQPSVQLLLYVIGYFFFCFLAPVVAFGGTAWRLRSARRTPLPESRVLLLILLAGAGAFFSELHSPDMTHLMWAAPLMLILLAYQWDAVVSNPAARRPALAATVIAVALLFSMAGRKAFKALRIDGRVETRRGVVYVMPSLLRDTIAAINAIQERVPPGGETFFYPYMAELYFLTDTRNPTRYDVLLPGFHSASHVEETIARLSRARPEFVFSFDRIQRWTIRPHFPDDPPDVVGPHPVERALASPASGYHQADLIADMAVFAADR
jgi:4-amino-4-deoxy-L-arabinose transferase-like glycosyltransferase